MAEEITTRGSKGEGSPGRKAPRMYRKVPCIRVTDGTPEEILHDVIEEIPYALFVNGRHMMTAMLSPEGLEDFVTGFLFTEQVIKSAEEIESIKIEKNRISVITTNLFKVLGPKKTILSGCGGAASYIDPEKLPIINSDFRTTNTIISDILKSTLRNEIHRVTGGVHVVALAGPQQIITIAEDIGRHNALDRVIGFALRKGIDLSHTFVIVSGRISSEMVRKCLVAHIPLIASRGATTTLSLEIAEKNGLTVVGFVRGSNMNIYTNPGRVTVEKREARALPE
ncbi:MAG TPA: formate dehydrogenase accessory sulfurtransferase FdhD [Methanolinea sp.]|nr:formate dehydrogenase accessory sulfurtransferase FdhD [Methanolinea sp.]HQK56185.1 formate dehydrogenase accessory sulfurtransferase FdhD [Methanolinea sp.]